MGFNDLILIEPVSVSALDRLDEVDAGTRTRMAERLQSRLRATIDPGVNLKTAVQAQAVRVSSEGDSFSVHRDDQAKIVKSPEEQDPPGRSDPNEVDQIDDLFSMSSGVPSVIDGRLAYRTISKDALFGNQKRAIYDQQVEQAVTSAFRDELLDAYEESFEEVARRNPTGTR